MNLSTRTYCPRYGSHAALIIQYFQKNLSAKLTCAEVAKQINIDPKSVHGATAQAIEAGFLARLNGFYVAGDDIDLAPDYNSVAQANATIAQAASAPLAAHNAFGSSVALAATQQQKARSTAAMPCPQTAVLEDGVPIPSANSRIAHDWPALLNRMQVSQSCLLPKPAYSTLSKATTLTHKQTSQKFVIKKISETEIRIWRTA